MNQVGRLTRRNRILLVRNHSTGGRIDDVVSELQVDDVVRDRDRVEAIHLSHEAGSLNRATRGGNLQEIAHRVEPAGCGLRARATSRCGDSCNVVGRSTADLVEIQGIAPPKVIVVALGRPVISATIAAFCTRLVPVLVLPLPGVDTVKRMRSPTFKPPGARMLLG